MNDRIEFFRHNIGDEEIQEVNAVLRSIFLTTGDKVYLFEKHLGEYLGIPFVIGLTSATGALHLSLLACDIGPGDEVITTPMSFIASANSIIMAGATPVFVDVEPQTGNINAELIEEAVTERTKAILPVHLYGNMCDMHALRSIADRKGLVIIEDCAHALESRRDGIRAGHSGGNGLFQLLRHKEHHQR
ncbi:MAG: DegT/DnrJ/EryC1/StrS family aminotransferase [Candidatus Xenobiia bacterium LiM19]